VRRRWRLWGHAATVEDVAAARYFYQAVGWRPDPATGLLVDGDGRYLWMRPWDPDADPATAGGTPTMRLGFLPVFLVADFDAVVDAWESQGGRILGREPVAGRPAVLAQDREGARLFLMAEAD
jgi:predicted enzyme related to lactoylglutathione lyase